MEAASKEKYFDNTIFVFIGDHGIPGDVGSMLPGAWTEQRLTSLHVPLLFYSPRHVPARRESIICSQVDVLPTIASLSGIAYTNKTLGRNILDTVNHRPFAFIFDPDYRQTGIIMDDYLYRRHLQTGKEELVSIGVNDNKNDDDSLRKEMRELNGAVYEAARYLLFNNKKSNPSPK
jgi:arylsulfatase A-like enzyme